MNFKQTKLDGVIIIEPKVFSDDRGYFCETFRQDLLDDFLGFRINFCQDNESKSSKNVFRGLHYQLPPFAQSKLVRVISGKVLDFAVDIRVGSPTFGEYAAVELSSENKKQLFIPRGFAHGFLVLSDEAIFTYKVDNFYSRESDRGISYKSIDFAYPNDMILSDKDKAQPLLNECKDFFNYEINYYG